METLAQRRAALKASESNDVIITGTDFRAKSSQILLVDRFWAIDGDYATNAVEQLDSLDIETCRTLNAEFMAAVEAEDKANPKGYEVVGNVALISIDGPMTKKMTSASYLFGGTSTEKVRKQIKGALADSSVSSILLHIESPGGQVSGTAELADDIREAGQKKNVVAYIEDIGASAAYWVASQAGTIVANKSASIGSIGVFTTIVDSSEAAARAGVKVNLVSTGKYKGAGQPGVKLTDAQLEQFQKQVDAIFTDFKDAVATGRGMSVDDVSALADGRMFKSDVALASGLIDKVCSFEECLTQVSGMSGVRQPAISQRPATASAQSAKEPQMNIKDLWARVRGIPADALAKAGIDPDALDEPEATSDLASLKADMDRMKTAALNQQAELFWREMITPNADGAALATWAEKENLIATFKTLALLDGGGQLQYGADGSFTVGPNLKAFKDLNLSRTKNFLQAELIPDGDPRGSNPTGIRMDLVAGSLARARNNGRVSAKAVEKIVGGGK